MRAAALASDPAVHAELLRCADGHHMRAARLWLQIASHVDNDDEALVRALRLSACCARRGRKRRLRPQLHGKAGGRRAPIRHSRSVGERGGVVSCRS